ncbi:MAG: hypothetical protein ACTSUE_25790 [Promethearchaeota archaeon]
MPIEEIDELFKDIKKKFDDDPENWRVLSDIDGRGNKDLFISQHDNLWQIKTKPIDPRHGIAKGFRARSIDDDIQDELRAKGLEGDKYLFSMVVPQRETNPIFASGIESFAMNRSSTLKQQLADKHKHIERDLQNEVEKEFEKKHFRRKNMFL